MDLHAALSFDLWLPWLVAVGCGALIGLERQLKGKPVGIRTSALICMGTVTFIRLGVVLHEGDPTRVLGQVVTGVGFLGAGVILTRDGAVAGMTSAAAVWFLAGVGAAIGYGYYAFGVGLTVFSLVVLLGVRGLERAFAILRRGVHAEHEDRA